MRIDVSRILRLAQEPPPDPEEGDSPADGEDGGVPAEPPMDAPGGAPGGGPDDALEDPPVEETFEDIPPASLLFGKPIDSGDVPNRDPDEYVDSVDDDLAQWGIGATVRLDLSRIVVLSFSRFRK